jgi:hypothetical protein
MRTTLVLATTVMAVSLVGAVPASAVDETISPSSGTNDGTKTFVISGPTAVADEAVTLRLAGHPDIAGTVSEPDAGPLCIKGLSDSGCGTSITVSVPLLNAYPGAYDVVRTQTPAGGGAPTTITKTAGYAVRSQPVISSINPSTRGQDSSSLITVTGTGFGPNPVVSFGSDIAVSGVTYVSATTLTVNIAVPADAVLGTRNLTVTSADHLSGTKSAALTITSKPTLTSVTPTSIKRGQTLSGVVFTGSRFATGGDFAITISGVDVTNPVASSDGTTVTATLAARTTSPYGPRTVQITNADGGRARLLNGLSVVGAPGAPQTVSAVAGDARVVVSWTAPADPGSSPITKWVITPSDSSIAPVEVAGSATSATVTGLTNGTSYSFGVHAENADAGAGPTKTTGAVTPKYGVALTAFSNRAKAISGQSAVIYGYLRRTTGQALSGRTVTLRIGPAVGAVTTRTLTTDVNGRWASSVVLTYNTSFLASFAGGQYVQAAHAIVGVPVATKITVTSPVSGAVVGSPFTVRGSVSPNKAGKTLGVYKVVNGTSTLVARATISSTGTYAASVRLPIGNYLLKVVLGPVSGNATGTSPQFVVKRR